MGSDVACGRCRERFPAHVVGQFGGLCPACVAGFAEVPEEGTLKPGSTFGRYEVLEAIGRGGMGVVYRARQTGLDRVVALKVLSERLAADPEFVRRFTQEAKTLASLSHANIVTVHDYGVEGGVPFLVMEHVEGVSLRRLLTERRLPPEEAFALVPQLCDALEYAHSLGVVHRDIKPENILVDTRGRVRIADFGLAVMLGIEAPRYTRTDAVMGTPHYMAPEQLESPRRVDHRADLYSMGVVIYEMLTGELPIGAFSMPSEKARVHRRLDEIVMRALAKEPERRYQRASEMKKDVADAPREPRRGWSDGGFEYRSQSTLLGWPLVHIRVGGRGSRRRGVARGVLAIGDVAIGLVAIGGAAFGGVAIGGLGVGLVSLGGCALAVILALGGAALGGIALGGGAVGYYALGGGAAGAYVVSASRTDWQAWDFFDDWPGIGDWLHANTRDPRPFAVDAWPEPSVRLHAGGDPDRRYWLIGPDAAKPPAGGWGLVLFLAGGDGGEEFHSFCKKIWRETLSDRYVAAQLIAKEWTPPHFSNRVWPTKRRPVEGMKFSTEEFAQAVIRDVATRLPIDSKRIFVLGWSSGGPGAYAVALHEPRIVSGALVAMSTFHPEALDLAAAKGAALYLHHSKDDTVVPFRLPELAVEKLTEAGAKVKLSTYDGGHGWHGNVYDDLRAGFDWLEKNSTR